MYSREVKCRVKLFRRSWPASKNIEGMVHACVYVCVCVCVRVQGQAVYAVLTCKQKHGWYGARMHVCMCVCVCVCV